MDVGARRRSCANVGCLTHLVEDGLAEAVDGEEIGAHALGHDLGGDVDHVGVAHPAAIDDVGHLHAAVQFVGLHLDGEDAHLRALHIFQNRRGHLRQGPRSDGLQYECIPHAADAVQFAGQRRSDHQAALVGNERHFFISLNFEAGRDSVARARRKLCGKLYRTKIYYCLYSLINHDVHLSRETYSRVSRSHVG